MTTKPTRRQFIGTSATSAVGLAGAKLYAADSKSSPNDTINLGVIGCGARARQVLFNRFAKLPGNRIVAACDVNSNHLASFRKQAGGDKVAAYHDFRKLLENKDVDAVVIAANSQWHVLSMIRACQAGKDVYLEKPLAQSIGEGRAAVNASKKYKQIIQFGTQQRSWEQFRKVVEIIQSGQIGDICEVKVWDFENRSPGRGSPPNCPSPNELDWDFFVGPSPMVPYNPNCYYNYGYDWFKTSGAGHQVAWGVHHFDVVCWTMGVNWPKKVAAFGGNAAFQNDNREWPDTFNGIMEFAPGPVAKRGFTLQYTLRMGARRVKHSHGKCFLGTKGSLLATRGGYWITSDFDRRTRKKFIEEREFKSEPDNHQEMFLENVRNRTQPFATVEKGHYATNLGHLMNLSYEIGRSIEWDGEKEQIVGDPEANKLVFKEYRKPWTLDI